MGERSSNNSRAFEEEVGSEIKKMAKKRPSYHKRCKFCNMTQSWYRRKQKAGWYARCNESEDRKHEFVLAKPIHPRFKSKDTTVTIEALVGNHPKIQVNFFSLHKKSSQQKSKGRIMTTKTWKYWTISVWHEDWKKNFKWHFYGSTAGRDLLLMMLETIPADVPVKIQFDVPNKDDLSTLM
jgi:hypothetical protein